FTNQGEDYVCGVNVYAEKLKLLFDRPADPKPTAENGAANDATAKTAETATPKLTVGIPRVLNMFEEYPFWHALFTNCGIRVELSSPSTFEKYEEKANLVMSDNICFPAKLVHGHIEDLVRKGVDRIFMPFVVFEKLEGGQNSYNCPVVAGYSEVIRSVQSGGIPIDSPPITFKDEKALYNQVTEYFKGLGITEATLKTAFAKAVEAQRKYEDDIAAVNVRIYEKSRAGGGLAILLAGRPYHSDPLIQHKISEMVASMGVDVLTDDIVRNMDISLDDAYFLPQWAYTNRILKAVKFAATGDSRIQCMQLTSFGCGPDAFLTDETRNLLRRYGKTLTLLKIDDIGNIGSAKLRVRSFIDSLRMAARIDGKAQIRDFRTTPPFYKEDRTRTIIAPFFTPFISPIIPVTLKIMGYNVVNLPVSDTASCDWGLKYANNEVCYPATLVVGDIVKAFKEGGFDPATTAVAMTQTGGQCRASNYISLIKRALVEAGYGNVPVISISFSSGLENYQPGFKVNWMKFMPIITTIVLYTDSIAKFYYASAPREKVKGEAARLKDKYLTLAQEAISHNSSKELMEHLEEAAKEFDSIVLDRKDAPKVGIVGEIYLKFNPFAQKNIGDWLVDNGIEVVPPMLVDFFIQSFVNYEVNRNSQLRRTPIPAPIMKWLFGILMN
ncbi:MAG: acyl-CoA dehydratase activase-related protein, partial [Bacteroidales bacterium]|nr:acyl-CoA dehydratase activase-related protein [Bacteroidales bacterium]